MNKVLISCGLLVFLLFTSSCRSKNETVNTPKGPSRPNVLLIITDDQGWGDINSHGNDSISTPNLDKLAAQSYRFDRFYVSPVCAPTRASVLTGRYHLRTGVHGVTGRREVMRNTEFSIAEIFKSQDYRTSYFGKWHNGAQYPHNPVGQGFEYFFGFCAGHWNNYFDTHLEYEGEMVKTEGYITDVLTDSAIAEIKRSRALPFFQYISYNTPHSPFQVPDPYFNKYRESGFDDKTAAIYGMVENIDDNVARLMKALEETGLEEKTIVIFMTDNGPNSWRFNGNMRGKKAWVDEGGVRVPFFLKIPWLSKEEIHIEKMAAHIDILPTLVNLCGLELPVGLELDGVDLGPYLYDREKEIPDRFIYTDRGLGLKRPWALRSEKYLLTVKKDTFLYDLKKDPFQKSNIAKDHPRIVENYINRYNKWYREVTAFGMKPPPIEVGHLKAPVVRLPAHEAKNSNHVNFKEGHGWANDWFVNFKDPEDSISWKVKVIREGIYNVHVLLNSPEENIGRELILSSNVIKEKQALKKAYLAKEVPSGDRVERKEVYERDWPELVFQEVYLEKGEYTLGLNPGRKGFPEGMEIKSLIIKAQNN